MNIASRLSLVLNPVRESEFYEHYWEQNPLHISRSSTEHFAQLLSLEAIETMLSTQALYFPSVQLTHLNKPIDVADYTDDTRRIVTNRLIERHNNGATLVISQAHEKIPSLADFRRGIQSALQLSCQTNVYLSPAGQQGFNAHFDSHDVFILQISGSKTFNFYDGGVDLPYSHENFKAGEHTVGSLTHSVKLEPGDTLYIPRGVLHDAVATEETSLHITLGVYALTLRDVLLEMTQQLVNSNTVYRKSVPRELLSVFNNSDVENSEIEHHANIPACLSPKLSLEEFTNALASIADSLAVDSAPSCQGSLTSSEASLSESGSFRLNTVQIISIEKTDERIRIRTHGQVLEFTQLYKSSIDRLLTLESISLSSFTDLNNEQKMALYSGLLSANLLISDQQRSV